MQGFSMFGTYENFPATIHLTQSFSSNLPVKKLQQKIAQVLYEINCKTFSFEEVGAPAVPGCTIIFEIGIANAENFNFVDTEETKKILSTLRKNLLLTMDLYFVIRYYKNRVTEKKRPLKFDYYLTRMLFGENVLEMQVFHERGPRYITPKDAVLFLTNKINDSSQRKILKIIESS